MRRKGLVVKLVVASFVVSLLLSSGVVYAGVHKNWELAYAHDEKGNGIYGSLQKLVNAIKSGADVKVTAIHSSSTETTFYIERIRIDTGNNIVTAKHTKLEYWDGSKQLVHRQTRLATDGTFKYYYDGLDPYEETRPMKWFVNR